MKRWKSISIVLALALLSVVACSKDPGNRGSGDTEENIESEDLENEEERQFAEVGKRAPLFKLKSLEGESYSLEDLRGKPVLLNFYSKDCRFCIDKFPELNQLYNENSEWAEIIAINVGEPAGYSEELRDEYGLNFPMLLDEDIETSIDYMVRSVPFTVIIDTEGLISEMRVGPMAYEEMVEELENAKK